MKIKYNKKVGSRIKKGTFKVRWNSKRVPIFNGLSVSGSDNHWWCEDLNKWIAHTHESQGNSFSINNDNIKNLKQAIRHIKKHKELGKGTTMKLCSNYMGHNIYIVL